MSSHYLRTTARSWARPWRGGVITGLARDAGTVAVVQRLAVPGMDRLRWVGCRWEEDAHQDLVSAQNADMVHNAGNLALAPWPEEVPRQAPIDLSARHQGLSFRLHEYLSQFYADVSDAWAEVPGGRAMIDTDPNPNTREGTNVSRLQRPEEIREYAEDPTQWVRLPFENETGNCGLKDPIHITWRGLKGNRFTLSLDDNDLFTPFDLTRADDYTFTDDDDRPIENAEVYSRFADRSRIVVYLRPRRWRWYVRVLAHFIYVSWFEEVPNDEWFLKIYYDRPPFWPVRHNVTETKDQQTIWHEWTKEYLSWDGGVDAAFNASRNAADLRYEILQQQWWALCMAYLLVSVEPASITIQREAPRKHEIVVGIERICKHSGASSRIWARCKRDLSDRYPRTYLGSFWAWFETGGPGVLPIGIR